MFTNEAIARVCHEANRGLQAILADPANPVSPPWDDASDHLQASVLSGVRAHRENPLTPEQSHEAWCAYKIAEGWVYGPVKDETRRTHPCLLPYDQLSEGDKAKDSLFKAIVNAMSEGTN